MNDDEKLLKRIEEDLKAPTPVQTYDTQKFHRFLSKDAAIQRKMDRASAQYEASVDEKYKTIKKLEGEIEQLEFKLSQISLYSAEAEKIREEINQKNREIKRIKKILAQD